MLAWKKKMRRRFSKSRACDVLTSNGYGDRNDGYRVDHRTLDLALERFAPFEKLGQALQDRLEGTTGLTGLDHIDVQPTEYLRALRHRFRERRSGLDLVAHVHERILELATLDVVLEDP